MASDHAHEHPHPGASDYELGYFEIMEIAIGELLVERQLIGAGEIRRQIEVLDSRTPALGAKVVARAWTDPEFRARAIFIKEQRSELVKHHLWVLGTDYFKAPHFEKYPQLNTLFNEATKLAGAGGTKGSVDVAVAVQLLGKIEEISKIFWETKQA